MGCIMDVQLSNLLEGDTGRKGERLEVKTRGVEGLK